MGNTKKRPEEEVYEKYWKMTAGLTDIYSEEFSGCLKIIIDYIDQNREEIDQWSEKKGKVSSGQYYRGSNLYDNLVDLIRTYKKLEKDLDGTTSRKNINQYVKIGFIYPFLDGYHILAKQFVNAVTVQEKKVLFSKMFYEGASFGSATTVDARGFGEVRFLLNTMEQNRYLTLEDIVALMGVTDIFNVEKGFLNRDELHKKYLELVELGFIERKYNQISHLRSMLNNFVDFKYLKKSKVFTFESDAEIESILADEEIPEMYKRDAVKHRIYKEELKLESESIYGIQQCYVEKLPYKVLIASHIKACGTCLREQDEEQAYDVNNGLLLSPNIDSYFDKYDISFDEEGKIMFGVRVHQKIRDRYVDFSLDKTVLNKKRLWYLDKHRKLFEKKQKALKKNS